MAWMVRDAVPADLEALVRIEGESQVTPWSEAAFRLYLREADDLVFLVAASAAFPGQALGFGLARLLQDTLEILNLAVTPAKRGRGLGRLLMEAMRESRPGRLRDLDPGGPGEKPGSPGPLPLTWF